LNRRILGYQLDRIAHYEILRCPIVGVTDGSVKAKKAGSLLFCDQLSNSPSGLWGRQMSNGDGVMQMLGLNALITVSKFWKTVLGFRRCLGRRSDDSLSENRLDELRMTFLFV
jgi:hypothetical protein